MIEYSFIIPVYNRPDEIEELLKTFPKEENDRFEIIIVEDGSSDKCDQALSFFSSLNINYLEQLNAGPGPARNAGAKLANGEWLIFLDSDTLLSDQYFKALKELKELQSIDFFGGPDANHETFSLTQKAIGYSMTSFLSTGGIRGRKSTLEKFKPRSFNMGIRKVAFERVGGFSSLRFGEDMDLSLRLEDAGYVSTFLSNALVYHKRRATFKQFFKQVFNSGMARIVLTDLHPGTMKLVHLFPLVFVVYHLILFGLLPFNQAFGGILIIYPVIYLIVGIIENGSFPVGILSIVAVYVQLFGYGLGFAKAAINKYFLGKPIHYAYLKSFYDG
jgi:glycosyltransferase involved in cell wall biosynthesis